MKIFITFLFFFMQFISYAQFSEKQLSEIKILSKRADVIVTGKIIKQKSNWSNDRSRIYTQATLQVDEYLKGNNNGNSVTVTYLGGEVDNIGELYTHMPRFENNEEVLVFLKKDKKENVFKVFNGEDGKIKVYKDEKTGLKITSSNVQIDFLKAQIKNSLIEK